MATKITSSGIVYGDNSSETSAPFSSSSSANATSISRSVATTYTNSNSRPIWIMVLHNFYYGTDLKINGTNVLNLGSIVDFQGNLCFMVPPGGTYRLENSYGTPIAWAQII
jgi:hypothetical protein